MSARWVSAQEAFSTFEVSDRRLSRDTAATIPCGLLRGDGRDCVEMFFTEEGRDLHHEEDHGLAQPVPERQRARPGRPKKPRRMWWDAPAPGRVRRTA